MSTQITQVGSSQVPMDTKVEKRNQSIQEIPSFKAERINDEFVKKYEVEATSSKKWCVGLASTVVSGLGQAINGDWGKSIAFFLGGQSLDIASAFAASRGRFGLMAAAFTAAVAVKIGSIIDAVKNAKSTIHQVDHEALATMTK